MNSSERLRTVEAVIISHKDFGEADRLVTLYSREAGKLKAIAKGVRKMGSRKAAYLEPFMRSKVSLVKGRTFWILTQADAVRQYTSLTESLEKTGSAAYVLELADRITIEEDPSSQLYRLITDTLGRIDMQDDAFNALLYYELNVIDQAGFRPDLTNCVDCRTKIKGEDQYFSTIQGGVVCPKCGVLHHDVRKVSLDALRYLRHFQRNKYLALVKVNIHEGVRKEISALMSAYFSSIFERRLNSPEFIRQVAHSANNARNVK